MSVRDTDAVPSPAATHSPTAQTWRGLALVCFTGTVWGTIGPAVHLIHEESPLSPLTICAYRAIAAVGALLLAALASGRLYACGLLLRQHWRRVAVVGTLTATFQLLFFIAVVEAGVSATTVVSLGFAPVLLLAVASARQRRLPSVGHLLTVTAAVVGLLLVSVAGGASNDAPNATLGIAAALASGAAYAMSADFAPPLSQRHDALTVTTLTMSVAAAVLVPGGLVLAHLRGEVMRTTAAGTWLLVIYLGVVTMGFAYVLLFAGLRTTPSGTAVVATLLEPVTAVLIAVCFLGERLTLAGALGSALIIAAIASLGRQSRNPAPQ
jgi:drug/metabolite transporter, DME family